MGEPSVGERREVLHAVRGVSVNALYVPRYASGTVSSAIREVADVQLVDHDVLGRRPAAAWPPSQPAGARSASDQIHDLGSRLSVANDTEYGSVTRLLSNAGWTAPTRPPRRGSTCLSRWDRR